MLVFIKARSLTSTLLSSIFMYSAGNKEPVPSNTLEARVA